MDAEYENLFDHVLDTLKDSKLFKPHTHPRIFIAYAHDSDDKGDARESVVRRIVRWLDHIGIPCIWDKEPVERLKEGDDAALHSVFANQIRILNPRISSDGREDNDGIDFVILFGSDLLKTYCESEFSSSYIEAIQNKYHGSSGQAMNSIEGFVCRQSENPAFHHILTELALLKIRKGRDGPHAGIIPVALHSGGIPYVNGISDRTNVYIDLKSIEIVDQQRLFLKIIERLRASDENITGVLAQYKDVVDHLKKCASDVGEPFVPTQDYIMLRHGFIKFLEGFKTRSFSLDVREGRVQRDTAAALRRAEASRGREKEKSLLNWLSEHDYSSAHNEARAKHTSGTGGWLLRNGQYTSWRREAGLFWLYGVAGCGKSVLCSTIISNLQSLKGIRLAYWYFQFSDIRSLEISALLRSLMRQLSGPPPSSLHTLMNRHKDRGSQPSLDELTKCLDDVIVSAPGEMFIILDALDEYPLTGNLHERSVLLDLIQGLIRTHSGKVHLLVTSRPEPDIKRVLHKASTQIIDIEESIRHDIKKYIEKLMDHNDFTRLGRNLTSRISAKLLNFEETRFRWANLQIQRLRKCPTKAAVEKALITIPKTLEDSYRLAFQAIDSDERESVRIIMMWLVSALEPLTPNQVATAAGYLDSDYVLQICSSLLVTIIDNHTTETIKLAHFSVQEYLTHQKAENESIFWWQFSIQLAHKTAALMSLDWLLNLENPVEYEETLEYDKLREMHQYSAEFWPQHAKLSEREEEAEIHEKICRLFDTIDSQQYVRWLKLFNPDAEHGMILREPSHREQFPQPLYYASLLDFQAVVQNLYVNDSQLAVREGRCGNAIQAAAVAGNTDMTKWLLRNSKEPLKHIDLNSVAKGIRTNVRQTLEAVLSLDEMWPLPNDILMDAIKNHENFQEVIQVLLELRPNDVHVTEEVLIAVAENYLQDGTLMMQLLLDRCPDKVHITEDVVIAVAENRHRAGTLMMQLLLDRCPDKVHITEDVVKAAAANPFQGGTLMQLLLDRCPDKVHITEDVVIAVAANRYQGGTLMQLLLDRCPDKVHITEDVVIAAAANRYRGGTLMMQLLLDRCPDKVHITEDVVIAAAEDRYQGGTLMQLLLDRCPDKVHITEDVVIAAAANRYQGGTLMQLLLDRCPDKVHITEDVVIAAAANRYRGGTLMMQLLLDRCPDKVHITEDVVIAVAENRYQGGTLMQLLLDRCPDEVHFTEDVTKAATSNWTVDRDFMDLIELKLNNTCRDLRPTRYEKLSEFITWMATIGSYVDSPFINGMDIEAMHERRWTPVHCAAHKGHVEVVKLLLEKGADIHTATENGWTPITCAADEGHVEVVKLLLEKGADIHTANNDDDSTPLHYASGNGHAEVVKVLLDKGADTTLARKDGRTSLHLASSLGHIEIVKMLLDWKPSDAGIKDLIGRSALFYAARYGSLEPARYLLTTYPAGLYELDNYGITPISTACRNSHELVVEAFLDSPLARKGFTNSIAKDLLLWAQRTGNKGLDRLIVTFTRSFGYEVCVASGNTNKPFKTFGKGRRYCDTCTLTIPDLEFFYACDLCYNFSICLECYEREINCRDENHRTHAWMRHRPDEVVEDE